MIARRTTGRGDRVSPGPADPPPFRVEFGHPHVRQRPLALAASNRRKKRAMSPRSCSGSVQNGGPDVNVPNRLSPFAAQYGAPESAPAKPTQPPRARDR
jgi:hypothetical protein